jgi:hypothetical protein
MRMSLVHSIVVLTAFAAPATAQLHSAFPDADPVPAYSPAERASAFQGLLKSSAPPTLGTAVAVTPNTPYSSDGTHLDFWKTSFVLGTPHGGEAGVGFWGMQNGGHINIGFKTGTLKTYALDCRLLSAGAIHYKVFMGTSATPNPQGESVLAHNHLLLIVPTPEAGQTMLVELWPTRDAAPMGFLGCDLSSIVP